RRSAGCDTALQPTTAAASTIAKTARHRHTRKAAPMTTTSSAAKLDCENETSSPSQVTTTAAAAASATRRERPSTIRRSDGAIATTRNRPYTDGSQKTELTRKSAAYAFELITFGFWKMSRVSYW